MTGRPPIFEGQMGLKTARRHPWQVGEKLEGGPMPRPRRSTAAMILNTSINMAGGISQPERDRRGGGAVWTN